MHAPPGSGPARACWHNLVPNSRLGLRFSGGSQRCATSGTSRRPLGAGPSSRLTVPSSTRLSRPPHGCANGARQPFGESHAQARRLGGPQGPRAVRASCHPRPGRAVVDWMGSCTPVLPPSAPRPSSSPGRSAANRLTVGRDEPTEDDPATPQAGNVAASGLASGCPLAGVAVSAARGPAPTREGPSSCSWLAWSWRAHALFLSRALSRWVPGRREARAHAARGGGRAGARPCAPLRCGSRVLPPARPTHAPTHQPTRPPTRPPTLLLALTPTHSPPHTPSRRSTGAGAGTRVASQVAAPISASRA